MHNPAVPRIVTTLLCLSVACVAGCVTEDVPQTSADPAATLSEILLGADGECVISNDCASGVCTVGYCTALVDAGQTWMEREMAQRVRELIARHPEVRDLLKTTAQRLAPDDPFLVGRFAGFLGALGDRELAEVLFGWTESPSERVRVRAWLALGELGEGRALDAVVGLTRHRSEAVVLTAEDALGSYLGGSGPTRDRVSRVLVGLLGAESHRVRQRAVRVLARIDAPAPWITSAIPARADAEEDGFLRWDAARALGL